MASGDFAAAEVHFQKALEMSRSVNGPASAETSQLYMDISRALVGQGKLSEAESYCQVGVHVTRYHP